MIRTGEAAGIGTITLARPEQRNALTPQMLDELVSAIEQLGRRNRVLLLGGEGRVFCAGFDLGLCRGSAEGAVMRSLLAGLHGVVMAMREAAVPVVVASHGAAIAGGCAIVAAADFAVAEGDARLGYPVVLLGISPAVSAPTLIPRMGNGPGRSRMLDPGLIRGTEAHRLGLVTDLVASRGEVAARATALARELTQKPSSGMTPTKRWLNELDGAERGSADGLEASLGLAGGAEERRLLESFWDR